jgi:hypothetical protein
LSPHTLSTIRRLEGRHVGVQLADGSRIDDCELVSAARRAHGTLWLLVGDDDRILPLDDVENLWERV